ncbi:MAG: hypothetical protein ACOX6L_01855 [Syntrophomonadaceae bacterium]
MSIINRSCKRKDYDDKYKNLDRQRWINNWLGIAAIIIILMLTFNPGGCSDKIVQFLTHS